MKNGSQEDKKIFTPFVYSVCEHFAVGRGIRGKNSLKVLGKR